MFYTSTRDNSVKVSSAEAIAQGISKDGGLFIPTEIPSISKDFIDSLVPLSYIERAKKVLSLYLTDFTADEIAMCVEGAYKEGKFSSEKVAPLADYNENASILELWRGPTCAFKDMALQLLPYLLTVSAKKTVADKTIVILVATSGDTGKAALEGFKDVAGTKIQVFYPVDGVSKIQKLQMATQEGSNVSVCAVYGNFDDAQTGVKTIFTNEAYKSELAQRGYSLSSANSINWGRLAPQIVYYFSAYCDLLKNGQIKNGDKINIVVPTGNFGNILAAYYAKLMGLPVKKLICASNSNNVLTQFIDTGVYSRNREFYTTISPSMDILISSNLERLLFHMSGCDSELISEYMSKLNQNGEYEVSQEIRQKISDVFTGGYCNDEETVRTIADVFSKYSYVIDTHTAVAVNVYEKYVQSTGDETVTVIASTANPFKFNQAVISAVAPDVDPEKLDEFEMLDALAENGNIKIPPQLAELRSKEVRFSNVCNKEDMIKQTDAFLV